MKQLKINKAVYNIPESFGDITLKKFEQIKKLKDIEWEDMIDYEWSCLSVFTDIPVISLKQLNSEQLDKINKACYGLKDFKFQTTTNPYFFLDGKYFVFDDSKDKMQFGMWINNNLFNESSDIWFNANKIAATIYREIDGKISYFDKFLIRNGKIPMYTYKPVKFNSDACQANEELFYEKVSIVNIYSALAFFLRIKNEYIQFTKTFPVKKKNNLAENKKATTPAI